jgi:CHAT domain-containing protein
MNFRLLICLISSLVISLFISTGLTAQSVDDTELQNWAELYSNGELSQLNSLLIDEVSATGENQFYAAYVWCLVFNNDETVRQQNPVLNRSCELRDFRTERNFRGMFDRFTPDEVAGWDNIWDIRSYYWGLSNNGYDDTYYNLLLKLLKNGSTDFNVAWSTTESISRSEPFRLELIETLEEENCCDPKVRGFLLSQANYSNPGDHQSLAAWDEVFGPETDDYEQIRFLAEKNSNVGNYAESANFWDKVVSVDPYGTSQMNAAYNHAESGNTDKALSIVAHRARNKALETGDNELDLLAVYTSMLYRDQGEWGKAREAVSDRLDEGGVHPDLYQELYRIENESKRFAEAVDAARSAFELKPDHIGLTNLMGILIENGDVTDAWDLFNRYREDYSLISERFYWLAGNALDQLEAPDIKLEIYQEALEYLPESGWMHRSIGDTYRVLGNLNMAITHLQSSIRLRSDNSWAFHRLADAYRSFYGDSAYQEYKQNIVTPNLAVQGAWSGLLQLDRFEGPRIFEEARLANPNEYWPVNRLTLELILAKAPYEMIYPIFDNLIDNLSAYHIDDQISFYFDFIETIRTQALETHLSGEMLELSFALLEEYRSLGGDPAQYHFNRYNLYLAAGSFKSAADELRAALDINPDNEGLYLRHMFSNGISSEFGSEIFIRYHQYAERNPWDGNRLTQLAHRHLRWGGSALVALNIYERISRVSPSYLRVDEYNSALSTLGKRSASFRNTYYNNTRGPAASDRYIGWYESTRLNAQESSVDFQLEDDGSLKVFHPNGIIAHYKDDPLTGKPLFIRYGSAYIEADYNSQGQLTELQASSGSGIKIVYDDRNNITSFTITEQGIGTEDWQFLYDENDRIAEITDGNEHSLVIERDESGEIINTNPSQGFQTSQQVTRATSKLTELANLLGNRRYSTIPDLPFLDKTLEELKETWLNTYGEGEAAAGIAYVDYLLDNLTDHQDNTNEAESVLKYMVENDEIIISTEQQLTIIGLWHRFLLNTRPLGVNQIDWDIWQEQLTWLEQQRFNRSQSRQADTLRAQISQNPVNLLPAARWVPESSYLNPAFWSAHPISQLGHQHNISVQPTTVIIRNNGDIIAGTTQGLAINRKGYWELLGFDSVRGRFSLNITQTTSGNGSSHILALAEDENEQLWIGTRDGLMLLDYDYTDRPTRWRTTGDGIPHPEISGLFMNYGFVFAATSGGLIKIDLDTKEFETLSAQRVNEINPALNYSEALALITQDDGIYLLNRENELVKIHEGRSIRSAILSPDDSQLLFLEGNTLKRKPIDSNLTESFIVPGQQDIVHTTDIQKLRYIPLPDENEETAIAVLTDQGITAWHNSNFEYLPLSDQLADRRVQVDELISFENRVFTVLQSSILEFNPYSNKVFKGVTAKEMLYAPEWDITFLATGNGLMYINDDLYAEPTTFDYISSDLLSLTSEGGLLTNDGSQIVYYEPGTITRTLLFDSSNLAFLEGVSTIQSPERFNSVMEASDGSIWATTPSTVFRLTYNDAYEDMSEYQEQVEQGLEPEPFAILEVFSMFLDPEEFPARSDMISGVYETKDGDIWVVASAETHRDYLGVTLSGGLLRWTGDGFERISDDMGSNWFVTSYTNIDEETAIAGTTSGFTLHQGSRFKQFTTLEDPSYMSLRNELPMLWLGTKGALFGENTFVFGTAGGVVLYNNGEWFYPRNLNRLLPEDIRFGERGGRHIHSVATNPEGIIYASTDRGLLVYDLGANTDEILFQSNGMFEQAVSHQQRRQLIRESDVIIELLMEDPNLKDIIADWQKEKNAINQLEDRMTGNANLGRMAPRPEPISRQDDENGTTPSVGIIQELEERRRNYESITRLLELEHHGAFQMLQLNPLDIAQLRHQLGENEHIVVYIPTEDKLTLQLIDRDEIRLIEVNIGSEELNYLSMLVADNLAGRDYNGRRTIVSTDQENSEPALSDEKINEHLSLLYESLLRPIETFIGPDDLLFVVPTGALNYLPFNSLIRSTVPRTEFAVQRFTMGVLPSMYLLDLVLRHQPSTSQNSMIIGDPDGSLPGAREEAEDIYRLLRPTSPLLLGRAADRAAVIQYASDARIVHFATHGKLNPQNPALSYLLLADNQQLSVADIMQLPLQSSDLVVLSACETGLGTSGLEYATLARAFAHAGAPTVLATLWEVPDEPSKLLITAFYENLNRGMNVFEALSEAQRNFLSTNQRYQSPVNWAGYVPFGKP